MNMASDRVVTSFLKSTDVFDTTVVAHIPETSIATTVPLPYSPYRLRPARISLQRLVSKASVAGTVPADQKDFSCLLTGETFKRS